MKRRPLLLITAAVQLVPVLAHAQTEQSERSSTFLNNLLWSIVPLLFLLFFFLFVLYVAVRFAQSGPGAKRAEQHMQQVEQQLERIARALEKKDTDAR